MGNDGSQRHPTNTGATPSNGMPGSGGPEWTGAAGAPSPETLYSHQQQRPPVSIWDTVPGGAQGPGPGVQTPDYGQPTGAPGGSPFPAAPQAMQQPGVGPAGGMDNFNNAAHSTWKSQYQDMMQGLDQNVQQQQNGYPVGPRATRYGLLGDPYGGGLI